MRNILSGTGGMVTPIPQKEQARSTWPLAFPNAVSARHHDYELAPPMCLREPPPAVRARGRITFAAIRYPQIAASLAYEFLGFPAFARQLHGNYAVRAAEPLYVRPDHDWEYRRDFDRLTALDQVRLHVLTIHRSEESKGVP